MTVKPGIYTMTFDAYRDLDACNWSTLKSMDVSPLRYRHVKKHGIKESSALAMGRALHCAVLEPEKFRAEFAVWEGKSRWGRAWDDFASFHSEKTILIRSEIDRVKGMTEALKRHPLASQMFKAFIREQTIVWLDRETGIVCKARIDVLVGDRLMDLKSTSDVTPRQFSRSAIRFGYPGQIAFYGDGAESVGLPTAGHPALVTVESYPPHDVVVFRCPTPVVAYGRTMYRRLLVRLAECMERDEWPGVAVDEVDLEIPAWGTEDEDFDVTTELAI